MRRVGIGAIVAGSLAVGLAAAVILPFGPWPTVDANADPVHAAVVSGAIIDVVEAVRTGDP